MKILVVNSGSSNCKLSLFEVSHSIIAEPNDPIWEAVHEWGEEKPFADLFADISFSDIDVIGHRLVHGGAFQRPTIITEQVKDAIREFSLLAPAHNPKSLEGIEILEKLAPKVPQVAVFDTAFHANMPSFASTYPGPYSWKEQGIKRYGFHGINYEYCAKRLAYLNKNKALKMVCCHLGNGASIAAIDGAHSVDTTMGFTPLEGLMMGSRSGSIDPGILLYLMAQGQTQEEIYQTLNFNSGLKGISGKTSDMRNILELCSKGDARAILSYKMYIHSLRRNIGAMAAVLEEWDALIFTGGIGEKAALVRQDVCKGLKAFGISLDETKEVLGDTIISSPDSKVKVGVIFAEEDWCIACKIEELWN